MTLSPHSSTSFLTPRSPVPPLVVSRRVVSSGLPSLTAFPSSYRHSLVHPNSKNSKHPSPNGSLRICLSPISPNFDEAGRTRSTRLDALVFFLLPLPPSFSFPPHRHPLLFLLPLYICISTRASSRLDEGAQAPLAATRPFPLPLHPLSFQTFPLFILRPLSLTFSTLFLPSQFFHLPATPSSSPPDLQNRVS